MLSKENLYKYCLKSEQTPIFGYECFIMFEHSFRKKRDLYMSDVTLYVVSRQKLKKKIPLTFVQKIYVAILSGQVLLITGKGNLIIDSIQCRKLIIHEVQKASPKCSIQYMNYTMLDQLFQKHKNLDPKVQLTTYNSNQKKVRVNVSNGQKLNITKLKQEWQRNQIQNLVAEPEKNYELVSTILMNSYWTLYEAEQNTTKKKYSIKIYPKKFIGMQDSLLNYIINEKQILENFNSAYTPNLVKSFFSASNIYLVCQYYNGYLLQTFKSFKLQKMRRLIGQIVVAIGQLHQTGLVYSDISLNGIMITYQGYVIMHNIGVCIEKGKQILPQIKSRPPQCLKYNTAQFSWDWWHLGLLIFQLVQGHHYFSDKMDDSIIIELQQMSQKLKINQKLWSKQPELLALFYQLSQKDSSLRIGTKNDYHQILHHPYLSQLFKKMTKTDLLSKSQKCQPVIKKVNKREAKKQKIVLQQQDWHQMNGYLKNYPFSRDLQDI